jgi:predicted ABC-type ATPase
LIAAGREVLSKVANHLRHRESFAIETTLSGKNYIQTMRNAHDLGFAIRLVYVGTSHVEINLNRIPRRVIGGGHHVPEADVRRRYMRSLQNLVIAAHIADFVAVYDNSTNRGYQEVVIIENGSPQWSELIPAWALPLQASFTK